MDNMYVCLCGDVNDKEIKEAIANGAKTVDDLISQLGVSMGCGACEETIRELLSAYLTG